MSDLADAAAAAPRPDDLSPALRFLSGGGRCARLILARDWAGHRLGPPDRWPDSLKTALSLVLNSPESMILAWDPDELSFFFNDAYIPLLGPRLDWAMGERFDNAHRPAGHRRRPAGWPERGAGRGRGASGSAGAAGVVRHRLC